MAERLIWKLGMTRDFLKSLPDDEIVNELIKMGVDEEMLGQLDHEGLIGLLDDMDDLDDEDLKDFDLKIVPMIRNQTGDSGMVMMVSSDRVIPTYAETLVDGIYPLRYLEGEIIDDGRGLTLRADDGVEYKLYAIPDDSIDFMNFVNECLPDFIPDNVNDLMASDDYLDDDMAYNEVINNLPQLIDDEDVIKDYAYIPAFEDNRKRIDNELDTNESLGESMSDLEKLDSFLGIDDVDESLTEASRAKKFDSENTRYTSDPSLVAPKQLPKEYNSKAGAAAYEVDPESIKKAVNMIYNMSDEDNDKLIDVSFDAYFEKDPKALKVVKELFKKYRIPMWALGAWMEEWDDPYSNKFFGDESLTEAGFFDKLTGKGNPPVTAILRIKHFNEYTNGAKGLPKVRSLFTRSRNGSSVLHEVAYYIYDLDPESYEISSRTKLGDKEFEKQNANFLKAVKNGENRQFEYLDADKLLAEKNKKDADDIAEVEKARKEGEKEARLKKEYDERQAQQKARNDADDRKSRDRFTSKQAARNNQTTYNSTKDEYYESLDEDADEYYVVSVSDMGGDSDYIKGPMTKEEATNYAKTLRKNASKYYKEKYLVYPKDRIPGRYKHLLDNDSLQESISLDQADREKLVDELSQIKSMDKNKLYNIDLLTTDLSDGSVEELFPVTTKLIVSFLSEMANITKEELADKDQINIWWTDGDLFDDRDWEALFNGADKLIDGKKRVLWKVYYSPYLDEDLNSDVYNALSDVAYDYEVNKNEPVYKKDFEEAEEHFNDKFFDGLSKEDYDESLNESLSVDLQNKIKEICDVMIANLDKVDLEYIIEESPYSEDGILSNDDLANLDGDESEIAEFAVNYINSKI